MGKASRKFKKSQQKGDTAARIQEIEAYRAVLDAQMDAGQYSEALDTIVKIKDLGGMTPDVMYRTALVYFMTCDYARAGTWVNNVMDQAPNRADVRVLLGKLLFQVDREDDGLKVFDDLLARFAGALTPAMLDEVESSVAFYGQNEVERIHQNFPHIEAFLKERGKFDDAGISALAALTNLKSKIAEARDAIKDAPSLEEKIAVAGPAADEAVAAAQTFAKAAIEEARPIVEEKVAEAKTVLEEKVDELKPTAEETLAALRKKIAEARESVQATVDEARPIVKEKIDETLAANPTLAEKVADAQRIVETNRPIVERKLAEMQAAMQAKVEEMSPTVRAKVTAAQAAVEETVADVRERRAASTSELLARLKKRIAAVGEATGTPARVQTVDAEGETVAAGVPWDTAPTDDAAETAATEGNHDDTAACEVTMPAGAACAAGEVVAQVADAVADDASFATGAPWDGVPADDAAEAAEDASTEAVPAEVAAAWQTETADDEDMTTATTAITDPEAAVAIAEATIEEIRSRRIPVTEQIAIIEQVAGAAYVAGNAEVANVYLTTAIELGGVNDRILRALSFVALDAGDREKALAYAAQMKETDFLLLHVLREA